MKKSLLGLALLIPAFGMNAQSFTEFFKVTYNGEEYTNGDIIHVLPDENPLIAPEEGKVSYGPHIHLINLEEEPREVNGSLVYVTPSKAEAEENEALYGYASLCFSGGLQQDLVTSAQNCLPPTTGGIDAGAGNVIVPAAGKDTFQWEVHLEDADPDAISSMDLQLVAKEGYGNYAEEVSDIFTLHLIFSSKENAAVEEIGIDANAPAEYYDLQGRRVINPAKGLYIIRQGGRTQKRIIL